MKKYYISVRKNPAILKNFSKSIGMDWSITFPTQYYKLVDKELKQYQCRLGFNYDEEPSYSFSFVFESEADRNWFVLRFS